MEVLLRRTPEWSRDRRGVRNGRIRQPPQQQHISNNSNSIGAAYKVPATSLDEMIASAKSSLRATSLLAAMG